MDDHTLPWLVDLLRLRLKEMGKRDKTLTLKFCKDGARKLLESLDDANHRLDAVESRGIDTGMGPSIVNTPMTAEEFIAKFPDAEENTNCLEDIACPKCGNRDDFRIDIGSIADVRDDGSETTDHEWDKASYCECAVDACDKCGTVADFTIEGLDDEIRERAAIVKGGA